jgi:hypothetical protein
MIDVDAWDALERRYRPTILKARAMPFKITLEVDGDSATMFKKDPLLRQECMDAASEAYQEFLDEIGKCLETAESNCRKNNQARVRQKNSKRLTDQYKTISATMQRKGIDAMDKQIARLIKLKKDNSWDNFSFTYKVVSSVATFSYSLWGLLTAPFTGGLSAVAAVVGLVSQGVKLYKDYQTHVTGIGQLNTEIEKSLKELKSSVKKNKGWAGWKDLAKTAWNDLVAEEAWFLEAAGTVKECEETVTAMRKKLRQMEILSHATAENLDEALETLDDMLTKIDRRHATHRDVAALQTKVNQLVGRIVSGSTKAKTFKAALKRFDADLDMLKGSPRKLYDYATKAMTIKEIGSDALDFCQSVAEGNSDLDKLASLAQTVIDEVVDAFEE